VKKAIVSLMGPTAAGKTELAFFLCDHFPFEIVSVDSALVYIGMDIGTAKPTPAEQARYPHHLIDVCQVTDDFSVSHFCAEALKAIEAIHQRGKIPLLVGGTMLYFKGLLEGLSPMPGKDETIRAEIVQIAENEGWGRVHELLQAVDPITAKRLHPNDRQRVQRALEVYRLTGKPISEFHQASGGVRDQYADALLEIALFPENRPLLHARIEKRFLQMMAEGFVAEVTDLLHRFEVSPDLPAMRAVGYRQVWEHLQGQSTEKEMIQKGIEATRQLAKRQLTWLRTWPSAFMADPFVGDVKADLVKKVEDFLLRLHT
jgi:tRNA dimethylallyltransferase